MPNVMVPVDKVIQTHGEDPSLAYCILCGEHGRLHESRYGYKFNARGAQFNWLKHKMSCAMNNYATDHQ